MMRHGEWPSWPERDIQTCATVGLALLEGHWAVASPGGRQRSYTHLAQERLAKFFERRFAVLTANGSAAIVAALHAIDIGPGCRVAVPALTWIGCLTSILRVGATPVLVDIERERPVMSIEALARTQKLDAILAIHLYASAFDTSAARAAMPNVPIIEDASHVHGGRDKHGRLLGGHGEIAVSSLQASKVLTCGEGGAALTDDVSLARRLEAARTDGRISAPSQFGGAALIPAEDTHGANYALAEPMAALLCDQLQRLPAQCLRRARGADAFSMIAEEHDLHIVSDRALVLSGGFYGLPILLDSIADVDLVRAGVYGSLGASLDTTYPRLDRGPLCRPSTLKRFASIPIEAGDFPHADRWSRKGVVIPHWLFLANGERIEALAKECATLIHRCNGHSSNVGSSPPPPVSVVVLSRSGDVSAALTSIGKQTYRGIVDVLVVLDGADLVGTEAGPRVAVVRIDLQRRPSRSPTVARVALLRNIALQMCETPLVCFLDDDNTWEKDHLERLYAALSQTNSAAAHSWRRLSEAGLPWSGDCFPWMSANKTKGAAKYRACVQAGIITPGDPIVRDSAVSDIPGAAMVDMGAWLFRRETLALLPLDTRYSEEELGDGIGEDDKLLERIVQAGVPIACSEAPTLLYRLGGFSNSRELSQ